MSEYIQKRSVWIIVLAITAILISLASASFAAFVYFNTPKQIDNYAQGHRKELKGDKGDRGDAGPMGLTGLPGATGASGVSDSLHCSTYNSSFSNYSSTDCY